LMSSALILRTGWSMANLLAGVLCWSEGCRRGQEYEQYRGSHAIRHVRCAPRGLFRALREPSHHRLGACIEDELVRRPPGIARARAKDETPRLAANAFLCIKIVGQSENLHEGRRVRVDVGDALCPAAPSGLDHRFEERIAASVHDDVVQDAIARRVVE